MKFFFTLIVISISMISFSSKAQMSPTDMTKLQGVMGLLGTDIPESVWGPIYDELNDPESSIYYDEKGLHSLERVGDIDEEKKDIAIMIGAVSIGQKEATSDDGLVHRGAHATSLACTYGKLFVTKTLEGSPLFKKDKIYDVQARFSNPAAQASNDGSVSKILGLALKLSENGVPKQDFILMNLERFLTRDASDFRLLMTSPLGLLARAPFSLSLTRGGLGAVKQLASTLTDSYWGETYNSLLPHSLDSNSALKLSAIPKKCTGVDEIQCYTIAAQTYSEENSDQMTVKRAIENAAVVWPTPLQPIGTLAIARKETPDTTSCEKTAFRATWGAHPWIGSLGRARRAIYQKSAAKRDAN